MTSATPAVKAILSATFRLCFRVVLITAIFEAPKGKAPITVVTTPKNK